MEQLTLEECRTIIDSLRYSKQRISDYPHEKYEYKLMSLNPLEKTLHKVTKIRDELKLKRKKKGE